MPHATSRPPTPSPAPRTPTAVVSGRLVVLATAVLGLTQAWWGTGIGHHASTGEALLAPLTVVAGVAVARSPQLETRLIVAIVVCAQLMLTGLDVTIGLPGQARAPLDATSAVAIGLAVCVLVALDVDRRVRHRADRISYPR